MDFIKQGEKLMLLVKRDSRATEEIATAMNIDKSYLPRLYKMEILPTKPFRKAMELFGVSAAYFLEDTIPPAVLTEPDSPYTTRLALLQTDNDNLREEIRRLSEMLERERSTNANLAEALKNITRHD